MGAPLAGHTLEMTQIGKYHTAGGHGFAAEDANHLADVLSGKQAKVVGVSNELNGADRLVGHLQVQSKYFRSATESVAAAFDPSTGQYRYQGQMLEVPKDQYAQALDAMRQRIARGQVPGYTNPADADKIVKQGTVTYQQARNIARAGNIDSIMFDARTQAVTCSYVFAMSFAITYAQGCWRGQSQAEATQAAVTAALKAGTITLAVGVTTAQLLRTKAAAVGTVIARSGVRTIAGTSAGQSMIEKIAAGSLGRSIHGAAATNHVARLLRTNAIAAAATVIITSVPDTYRLLIARSISAKQYGKNLAVNAAGVAGGSAGWLAGVGVGATVGSIVPVAGTLIGGFTGGIAGALTGGYFASKAARNVADKLVDDDARRLLPIVYRELEALADEYLLIESELQQFGQHARQTVTPRWLRRMFKASRQAKDEAQAAHYVRQTFEPITESLIKSRKPLTLPATADVNIPSACLEIPAVPAAMEIVSTLAVLTNENDNPSPTP